MKIGIGSPNTIPGADPAVILEWARRADDGPFSSLAFLDRLVFGNHDSLVTIAASAAVTSRIRLMSTVLLSPLHPAGLLAKQAATIDSLSAGRLTLGLGVGGREDDYLAALMPFHDRGKLMDDQLAAFRAVWNGESLADGVGPIGPRPVQPGGPEILIGGGSAASFRRMVEYAAGWVGGGGPPAMMAGAADKVRAAWRAGGRTGEPRLVANAYYALGPNAAAGLTDYLTSYYGPMGGQLAAGAPATPDAVRQVIAAYQDLGFDEVCFWPAVADLDQVAMLAEVV